MPAVSVVMPAYNVDRYLAEAIESVLAQTYTDYELIIVDDGSTDESRPVAERYRAIHPDRITVVSQENRGLAGARNTAIRASSGRVIALLDSDDGWAPGFLEAQVRLLQAYPEVAIVTGNAYNRGGLWDGRPVCPVPDPRPLPDLVSILRDETAVFVMSVFRREVVDRIGPFDEQLRTNEDYDYWIRAALAGFRFMRNPEPLAFYRRHGQSLSADEVRMLTGILRVYRKAQPSCPPGEAAEAVAHQIAQFETRLLSAETRAALARGDVEMARARIRELRVRRGDLPVVLLAGALRCVPRAAIWTYGVRMRARKWLHDARMRRRQDGTAGSGVAPAGTRS
jgi:glycosyltransferase involved in cell wall biosynthesis